MWQTYCSHKRVTKREYLSRLALRLCDELYDGLTGILVVHDPDHRVLPNAYNGLNGYFKTFEESSYEIEGHVQHARNDISASVSASSDRTSAGKFKHRNLSHMYDACDTFATTLKKIFSGMNPMITSRNCTLQQFALKAQ